MLPSFPPLSAQTASACGAKHARLTLGWRRAFTLIELLVATAITALLMGLLAVWAVGAWRTSKVRSTAATMNAALALSTSLEQKALIKPDHRYANFYWVQPHASPVPQTPGGQARQLSSAEFLVWLASGTGATSASLESIGRNALVPSTAAPRAWGTAPDGEILVDIYEQNPEQTLPLLKQPLSTDGMPPAAATYACVSGPNGYRLRTLVDAWGNELVYRRTAHYEILNAADTEVATTPFNTVIREKIRQDEAATVARYQAAGIPVPAGELLRPAIPSYPQAQLLSAGPDGKWGRFTDGTPPLHSPDADARAGHDTDGRDNASSIEWGR